MKRLSSVLALSFVLLAPAIARAAPQKLLLTEVVVAPSEAEYVAIYNPGSTSVDLTSYYLSDSDAYYKVVTGTAPSGASDFIARFPAGANIGPGQKQYVSIGGAECFKSACGTTGGLFTGFGVYPTYELPSLTATNNSDAVLDMIAPFANAIGDGHNLTNGGEPIMLFYWDGNSSLVTDVDYVCYGSPSFGNPAVHKTNQTSITGPSGTPGTYQNDTADGPTHHAPLGAGPTTTNTCRVMPYTEGTQATSGGNGINGSDETSEPTATTWTACTTVTPTATGSSGSSSSSSSSSSGTASSSSSSSSSSSTSSSSSSSSSTSSSSSSSSSSGTVSSSSSSSTSSSSSSSSSTSSSSSSSSSSGATSGATSSSSTGGSTGTGGMAGAGGSMGVGGMAGATSSSSTSGSIGAGGMAGTGGAGGAGAGSTTGTGGAGGAVGVGGAATGGAGGDVTHGLGGFGGSTGSISGGGTGSGGAPSSSGGGASSHGCGCVVAGAEDDAPPGRFGVALAFVAVVFSRRRRRAA